MDVTQVHGIDGAVFHLLRKVLQSHTAIWSSRLPGMTKTQWTVLREVAARPGQTLGTVGSRVAIDKATLTPLVARLVERGWLTYQTDPDDRRLRLLVLTDEGHRTARRAAPVVEQIDDVALVALDGEERRQLRDLLTRLV